jgi:hypothetical protein
MWASGRIPGHLSPRNCRRGVDRPGGRDWFFCKETGVNKPLSRDTGSRCCRRAAISLAPPRVRARDLSLGQESLELPEGALFYLPDAFRGEATAGADGPQRLRTGGVEAAASAEDGPFLWRERGQEGVGPDRGDHRLLDVDRARGEVETARVSILSDRLVQGDDHGREGVGPGDIGGNVDGRPGGGRSSGRPG